MRTHLLHDAVRAPQKCGVVLGGSASAVADVVVVDRGPFVQIQLLTNVSLTTSLILEGVFVRPSRKPTNPCFNTNTVSNC